MTITRMVLFIAALGSGLIGMGLLQLGGVTREQGPGTFLTMVGTAVVAVVALGTAAFLKERKHGFRAVLLRTLFLVGVCGLAVSAPFVVLSRGELLGITSVFILLLMLYCIVRIYPAPST